MSSNHLELLSTMNSPFQGSRFSSRDTSLDVLRGLLVILVLVLHAEMISGIGRTSAVGYLNMIIGPVLMPLFFVISGLLGEKNLWREWKYFFSSQVLRLLWPFLIWGLVYAGFVSLVEKKLPMNAELITSMVLRPSDLGPIWYLHFLLAFFILARILRRLSPILMMALFVAGSLAASVVVDNSPSVLIHGASFFLGLSMARYPAALRWPAKDHLWRRTFLLGTLVLFAVSPHFAGDSWRDNGWVLTLVLFACALFIEFRSSIENAVGSSWVMWIGVNSLPIYLAHWPVMLIVWRVAPKASVQPAETFWVALATALLIGTILALLANRIPWVAVLFAPPNKLMRYRPQTGASAGRFSQ